MHGTVKSHGLHGTTGIARMSGQARMHETITYAKESNEDMANRDILEFPDPLTGIWVRGYRDDNGEMIILPDEEEVASEPAPSVSRHRSKARKPMAKGNRERRLCIRMPEEEYLRFQRFCRWYSLTNSPTSMASMVKGQIDYLYKKHPAFKEFEKQVKP